jgi:hypothetical protein
MTTAKTERSLRLLGRKTLELDRVTGSNGEIFYDTDTGSLRIYSSNGVSAVVATRAWVTANSPQSDWNQATSTAADFIKNKPAIPTNTNQLSNGAGFITSTGIPSQTGNTGKYLTTNGTAVSWATVTATVTASDVGLGNVTNESKATMFASPTFTGTVNLSTATASTSTTTGALTVAGGAGVGGNLYVGGGVKLIAPSGDKSFSIDAAGYSNALIIEHNGSNGYISSYGTNGDLYVRTGSGKSVRMESTASSTSTTTGALVVSGGVGVAGDLNVGGIYTPGYQQVNAAGSTQGSATAITKNVVKVLYGSSGGVRLPVVPDGTSIRIRSNLSTSLNVYPPTGQDISGATGTNTPFAQNPYTIKEYQFYNDLWFVMSLL